MGVLQLGNFMEVALPEQFDYSIAMGVFDYLPQPQPFLAKMKAQTRELCCGQKMQRPFLFPRGCRSAGACACNF